MEIILLICLGIGALVVFGFLLRLVFTLIIFLAFWLFSNNDENKHDQDPL